MKKPTKQEIQDQFYYSTKYLSGYYLIAARQVLDSCLENDFIPDELLCLVDSINFYFNSEDISSMDNLPKRSIWIEVKDDTTFIQTEECGNYFVEKFYAEKINEYKEFLNGKNI